MSAGIEVTQSHFSRLDFRSVPCRLDFRPGLWSLPAVPMVHPLVHPAFRHKWPSLLEAADSLRRSAAHSEQLASELRGKLLELEAEMVKVLSFELLV